MSDIDAELICPACGESAPHAASWCEACGADLDDPSTAASAETRPSCVSCDAPGEEVASDGYCTNCGHKQPSRRDHLVVELESSAGVSDRGKRHHQNEDAFALTELDGVTIAVVCDGVSSTDDPEEASQRAADTAVTELTAAVEAGADLDAAMVEAVAAAHRAVVEIPRVTGGQGAPSCTFVATVTRHGAEAAEATIGWLGDSRAYALADDEVTQLTSDHSWALEAVRAGEISADQAAADPRAHSITRWIGADAIDLTPEVVTVSLPADARFLLCSDGLWNYAPTTAQLGDLWKRYAAAPVIAAEALTDFANSGGGHDNITVVIVDPPADPAPSPTEPPSPTVKEQP